MARLDSQRQPGRYHARLNYRHMRRGADSAATRSIWGDGVKGAVVAGTSYPAEPTVVASDGTNAARLAGLGYVASPTTAWTAGQRMYVGPYAFNWSGAAWAAGAHA